MEDKVPAPISRLIQLRHTIAQPVVAAFIAGGLAGAVSRTVVSPLERLKILFQIQSAGRTEYKLPIGQGLMKMWRDEGWRGFMRGNGANCIRIIPYSAVQFASYNTYRKVCRARILRRPLFKNSKTPANPNTQSVDRYYARDTRAALEKPPLWWPCWHYICHFHIPSRSCQNSTFSADCRFCQLDRRAKEGNARHVEDWSQCVQDRRWFAGFIWRIHTNHSWCGSICESCFM